MTLLLTTTTMSENVKVKTKETISGVVRRKTVRDGVKVEDVITRVEGETTTA